MGLYREKALEKLQSPERVDEVLQVVQRRDAILLGILAGLILAALGWATLGSIPVTAEGQAVLLRPSSVVGFQAPAAGQLVEWLAAAGDRVAVGDPLARLDQPELLRELEQARAELAELRSRNRELEGLGDNAVRVESEATGSRRRVLVERIGTRRQERERAADLAARAREARLAALASQERSLGRSLSEARGIAAELRERARSYENLEAEGLVSRSALTTVRQEAADAGRRRSELELQLREVEQGRIAAEQELERSSRELADLDAAIVDLEQELRELDLRAAEQERQRAETAFALRGDVTAVERRIALLADRLEAERFVRSDEEGVVLELVAQQGQRVAAGERLGMLGVGDGEEQLTCLAYFEVKDGKKLEPGMAVRVTPDSVQRERFGSLIGRVESVSPYPVSTGAAAQAIGNGELAGRLTAEGRQIEVRARLEPDLSTTSGLRWTSRAGPELVLSAGTTGLATVTVERRRPVSFVVPLLREATGLGNDARDPS